MLGQSALARALLLLESDSLCLRCRQRLLSTPRTSRLPLPRRSITTSAQRKQEVAFGSRSGGILRRRDYFWTNGVLNELLKTASCGRTSNAFQAQRLAADAEPSAAKPSTTAAPYTFTSSGISSQDTPSFTPSTAEVLPHRPRRRKKHDHSGVGAEPAIPLDASNRLTTLGSRMPTNSLRRLLTTYLSLSKPRLTFLIVLTTTAAYSLYPVPSLFSTSVTTTPSLSTVTLAFLTTGTFLTSASANALNMLLEPQHDAKMSRTRNRPLVRGLISKRGALLFAIATGITGTVALYIGVNPTTSFLAASNILLYAFVYTPLKRISVVNTWIGAIVGGIPPLMGWTAAAGHCATGAGDWKELLFGERSAGGWLLAALLYAWQFPHFNALSWTIREEYKNAGYRMLCWTNTARNARVALRYSILLVPISIGLAYVGVVEKAFVPLSLAANGWVVYEAVRFWRYEGMKGSARGLFWASVWHLPIVLVLAMVLKKGLWDRVWGAAFRPEQSEEDEWVEEDVTDTDIVKVDQRLTT